MSDKYTYSGWCCTDCLMELANGEGPADLSETELAERNTEIDARNAGYRITLGLLREEHACATNYMVTDVITGKTYEYRADDTDDALNAHSSHYPFYRQPLAATAVAHELETESDRGGDCECETQSFSWSSCDVCGSSLGGERHAVSFWKIPES